MIPSNQQRQNQLYRLAGQMIFVVFPAFTLLLIAAVPAVISGFTLLGIALSVVAFAFAVLTIWRVELALIAIGAVLALAPVVMIGLILAGVTAV